MMAESECEPAHFQGRIIFMSVHSDIDWENEETKKIVLRMLAE